MSWCLLHTKRNDRKSQSIAQHRLCTPCKSHGGRRYVHSIQCHCPSKYANNSSRVLVLGCSNNLQSLGQVQVALRANDAGMHTTMIRKQPSCAPSRRSTDDSSIYVFATQNCYCVPSAMPDCLINTTQESSRPRISNCVPSIEHQRHATPRPLPGRQETLRLSGCSKIIQPPAACLTQTGGSVF
jgi:hypothetical protein